MNKVVLIGNLTRDIELRYTQGGYCVGNAGIAVTRKFKNAQGETAEETCFIDLKFFGRTAEVVNQYLRKGSKLAVEGRLKLEQWQDQSGQNRSRHVVEIESLEMLGSPQNSGGTQTYAQSGGVQGGQAPNQSRKPAPQSADKYDDGNDTIPF
ncbi:single-stranded DNA-binding protein [uncultured Campylobacter sp.]|uniref:single-stranded DNA-binding protein n=1 Tax=uncultured Campylobacter sp. TaxID=218934 RepID=UPI002612F94D|nr:single-stranded DNA-binding protein [uncultured Campylobacter sp.]